MTGEDIAACGWQEALAAANLGPSMYSDLFFSAAAKAEGGGEEKRAMALGLLGAATSMWFDPEDLELPLKPLTVFRDRRSIALEDFQEQHLKPLSEALQRISDVDLRARIGDILWLRKRDHKAARIAASAYLEQARAIMDIHDWPDGFHKLQRAFQIALGLGKTGELARETASYCFDLLERLAEDEEASFLTLRIAELLSGQRISGRMDLIACLRECGAKFEAVGNHTSASDIYERLWVVSNRVGDAAEAKAALILKGEACAKVGEGMAATGNPAFGADYWIEQAIHSLRRAGGMQQRCDELLLRLDELQRLRLSGSNPITTEIPIGQEFEPLINCAKGLAFPDAIRALACLGQPYPKTNLRDQVLESVREFPLQTIFAAKLLREDGRTDAEIPPLEREGEDRARVLEQHMWRQRATYCQVYGGLIYRAVRVVALEHDPNLWDFAWLLEDNSFVPPNRVPIYARAIRAGLEADYLVSTHLLIPQLENSFRHVLSARPFFKADSTQDEQPMNPLLESAEFAEVFGEDMAFELRGLLIERSGSNLRHATSHGLLPIGAFESPIGVYLWAVTLWLLVLGKGAPTDA